MKKISVYLLILLGLLLVACSPAAPAAENTDTAAVPAADEATAADDMAEDDMASDDMADDMTEEEMADDMAEEEMVAGDDHDDMADDMASEEMASEEMADEEMADDMSDEMADEEMAVAAWKTVPLTDVRTGETFTLADFAGQTVFVEPMATWCTNCRRQLENVQAARVQFGLDDIVFVGLSVETNISNEELAGYVNTTGFDWPFAVASPELLELLVAEYGRTIVNPPSTPHFIILPDGTTTDLSTGIDTPEEINAMIEAAQEGQG